MSDQGDKKASGGRFTLWWQRHRLAVYAAAWLLTVYSTLPIGRPVTEYLRARGQLGLVVLLALALPALVLAAAVVRARPGPRTLGVLVVGLAALAVFVSIIPVVALEERLHFFQYGVFSALVWAALVAEGNSRVAISTCLLNALAGTVDEVIQALLPRRYFDWRDVALNVLAGCVTVLLLLALKRAARWDSRELE